MERAKKKGIDIAEQGDNAMAALPEYSQMTNCSGMVQESVGVPLSHDNVTPKNSEAIPSSSNATTTEQSAQKKTMATIVKEGKPAPKVRQ